jgi:hypothetical protein
VHSLAAFGLMPVTFPTLDVASLTRAHVALCAVEQELKSAGRHQAADAIAYADLVVLALRHVLTMGRRLVISGDDS